MKKKPVFVTTATGRWMPLFFDFHQMKESEDAMRKATEKLHAAITEEGGTVEHHMHDEWVVTLPLGKDFSDIEQRVKDWLDNK